MMNFKKYKRFQPLNIPDRQWPSKAIEKAPIWCSVDLRDGNQALPIPMNVAEKLEFFNLLISTGFREIEVGFPSASEVEYTFLRELIDNNLIPSGISVQVLTQSRKHLIQRTFEALQGTERAIVHLYNSTSELQRRVVFNKDKNGIKEIALEGANYIMELAASSGIKHLMMEYSPESFSGTEPEYAVEICEAVMDVWKPSPSKKIILNLPNTVEMAMPNIYADQIEWFNTHIKNRKSIIISLHTHNDRGTGVAATELGILAGAERVEGTLFGNGERTGNSDLLTIALNLFSQGIDPGLDFSNINRTINIYEKCTRMTVHPRHPYAGELVYTAFSGSHQDAIKKGLDAYNRNRPEYWEVPYLPIDPSDVGREYEAIIRINSQSGKGGVAYIMEHNFGYRLPRDMHPEFARSVQNLTDSSGEELAPERILALFRQEYLEKDNPLKLLRYKIDENQDIDRKENIVHIQATVVLNGKEKIIKGEGNGPIDAFFNAMKGIGIPDYRFVSYDEHALTEGSDSRAVAYIGLENSAADRTFGVGIASNITTASLYAIVSAVNRLGIRKKQDHPA
jgi:2-isopropylmalate synthase